MIKTNDDSLAFVLEKAMIPQKIRVGSDKEGGYYTQQLTVTNSGVCQVIGFFIRQLFSQLFKK